MLFHNFISLYNRFLLKLIKILTFLQNIASKKLILPGKILLSVFQKISDAYQLLPDGDRSIIAFGRNFKDIIERVFIEAKVYSIDFIQNLVKTQNQEMDFREYQLNKDDIIYDQRLQTLHLF
jgi:hypothetical protein